MKPPPFGYLRPTSVEEVVNALARHGDEAKVLAGGQSLVPLLNFRLARPSILIDLDRVPGLDGITIVDGQLRIGTMVRQSIVERHPLVRQSVPLLPAAIRHVGHVQIRNRGTVGGSIAHADPAAELPAVALALGATIEVRGGAGDREIAADDLFAGPFMTTIAPDEMVCAIRFPIADARRWSFLELARRHGDFALAGVVVAGSETTMRLVAFGMGWTPVRLPAAEEAFRDGGADVATVAETASQEVDPMGDIQADADWRREAIGTLVARALCELRVVT